MHRPRAGRGHRRPDRAGAPQRHVARSRVRALTGVDLLPGAARRGRHRPGRRREPGGWPGRGDGGCPAGVHDAVLGPHVRGAPAARGRGARDRPCRHQRRADRLGPGHAPRHARPGLPDRGRRPGLPELRGRGQPRRRRSAAGPGRSLLGGHAILLVGYDRVRGVVYFRNSWGTGWGDQGYGTLPFAYVENSQLFDEAYVLRAVR